MLTADAHFFNFLILKISALVRLEWISLCKKFVALPILDPSKKYATESAKEEYFLENPRLVPGKFAEYLIHQFWVHGNAGEVLLFHVVM